MQLEDVIKLAQDYTPQIKNFRVAAALVKGRTVLGYGFNRRKTHPLQARFSANPDSVYLHAEIDAIRNALQRYSAEDLGGARMLVARVLKNGTPAMAKPCPGCQRALLAFDIGGIEYTL